MKTSMNKTNTEVVLPKSICKTTNITEPGTIKMIQDLITLNWFNKCLVENI